MGQLTKEQRHFCREVVNGKSARLAYIAAFDCKASAAGPAASRLMKRVYIQEEINRLRGEARAAKVEAVREAGRLRRAVWDKVERMERLQEWAELAVEAGRLEVAIKCVDVLNKMDGAYVQEREVEAVEDAVAQMRRAILEGTSGRPMVKQYG